MVLGEVNCREELWLVRGYNDECQLVADVKEINQASVNYDLRCTGRSSRICKSLPERPPKPWKNSG